MHLFWDDLLLDDKHCALPLLVLVIGVHRSRLGRRVLATGQARRRLAKLGVNRRSMVLHVGVFGGDFTEIYDPSLVSICREWKRVFLFIEFYLVSKGPIILPSLLRNFNLLRLRLQLWDLDFHLDELFGLDLREKLLCFEFLRRCGPL